jgi:hypothetical protein
MRIRRYGWIGCLCWLVVTSPLTLTTASAAEPVQTFMLGNTTISIPGDWLSAGIVSYAVDGRRATPREWTGLALRPEWMSITFLSRNQGIVKPLNSSSLPWQVWIYPTKTISGHTIEESRAVAREARRMTPDDDGFVLLPSRPSEYRPEWVLVGSEADHPSGAPFIVRCRDWDPAADMSSYCRSSFRWSDDVSVMFDFDLRLFPKRRWSEIHRSLTELLTYLTKMNSQ